MGAWLLVQVPPSLTHWSTHGRTRTSREAISVAARRVAQLSRWGRAGLQRLTIYFTHRTDKLKLEGNVIFTAALRSPPPCQKYTYIHMYISFEKNEHRHPASCSDDRCLASSCVPLSFPTYVLHAPDMAREHARQGLCKRARRRF